MAAFNIKKVRKTMKSINFNSGIKEYIINGDERKVISINVADIGLSQRFNETQKQVDDIINSLGNAPTPDELKQADKQLREKLDYALGSNVADTAFGSTNCLSVVGGDFMITNFLRALIPIVTQDIEGTITASRIRLKEVENKYVKPVLSAPVPVQTKPQPNISADTGSLTSEQKDAVIAELLKQLGGAKNV